MFQISKIYIDVENNEDNQAKQTGSSNKTDKNDIVEVMFSTDKARC